MAKRNSSPSGLCRHLAVVVQDIAELGLRLAHRGAPRAPVSLRLALALSLPSGRRRKQTALAHQSEHSDRLQHLDFILQPRHITGILAHPVAGEGCQVPIQLQPLHVRIVQSQS